MSEPPITFRARVRMSATGDPVLVSTRGQWRSAVDFYINAASFGAAVFTLWAVTGSVRVPVATFSRLATDTTSTFHFHFSGYGSEGWEVSGHLASGPDDTVTNSAYLVASGVSP